MEADWRRLSLLGDLEARKKLHRLRCRRLRLNSNHYDSEGVISLAFQSARSHCHLTHNYEGTGCGFSRNFGHYDGDGDGCGYEVEFSCSEPSYGKGDGFYSFHGGRGRGHETVVICKWTNLA